METFRLKNIAILILLLLNAGLLVLIGSQRWQSRRAASETVRQLEELCAASQLTLGSRLQLSQQPLSALAISRHGETERVIASYLLGSSAVSSSQGGGIYSYSSDKGSIQFRSGGSFDGLDLRRQVEDPEAFAQDFCRRFGYDDLEVQAAGAALTVTAGQRLLGVPIYGCAVTLHFEGGVLTAVSGSHVSSEDAVTEPGEQLSCATALLRFLDFRAAAGVVCSEVREVRCVYELQSNSAALRLHPLWQIDTDTYRYFVDCATGAVTRQ